MPVTTWTRVSNALGTAWSNVFARLAYRWNEMGSTTWAQTRNATWESGVDTTVQTDSWTRTL